MALDMNKPHKGRITDIVKYPFKDQYLYLCNFLDHPVYAGKSGHTSLVVKEEDGEIETLNSRYTIV